ncbi:MAG: MEDS domain-containing protein [Chloroflexota bacterium]|nr:MEDS domain-containing protein [Chloroflexota bacterium]
MDLSVEGKSERIPPGSHILQLYNKVGEISGVTAKLLESGLTMQEKCLFAGSEASVAEMSDILKKAGIDVDAMVQSGQMIFVADRDSLLVGKRFDPYHLLSTHQTFIAQALREGWKAVRVSMDMTWLTGDIATPEQILKYEAASDAVFTFQNAPIIALMHYDYSKLQGLLVVELLKLHPIAVVGKFIKRNPYYLNSEQYLLKILRVNRDKSRAAPSLLSENPLDRLAERAR